MRHVIWTEEAISIYYSNQKLIVDILFKLQFELRLKGEMTFNPTYPSDR